MVTALAQQLREKEQVEAVRYVTGVTIPHTTIAPLTRVEGQTQRNKDIFYQQTGQRWDDVKGRFLRAYNEIMASEQTNKTIKSKQNETSITFISEGKPQTVSVLGSRQTEGETSTLSTGSQRTLSNPQETEQDKQYVEIRRNKEELGGVQAFLVTEEEQPIKNKRFPVFKKEEGKTYEGKPALAYTYQKIRKAEEAKIGTSKAAQAKLKEARQTIGAELKAMNKKQTMADVRYPAKILTGRQVKIYQYKRIKKAQDSGFAGSNALTSKLKQSRAEVTQELEGISARRKEYKDVAYTTKGGIFEAVVERKYNTITNPDRKESTPISDLDKQIGSKGVGQKLQDVSLSIDRAARKTGEKAKETQSPIIKPIAYGVAGVAYIGGTVATGILKAGKYTIENPSEVAISYAAFEGVGAVAPKAVTPIVAGLAGYNIATAQDKVKTSFETVGEIGFFLGVGKTIKPIIKKVRFAEKLDTVFEERRGFIKGRFQDYELNKYQGSYEVTRVRNTYDEKLLDMTKADILMESKTLKSTLAMQNAKPKEFDPMDEYIIIYDKAYLKKNTPTPFYESPVKETKPPEDTGTKDLVSPVTLSKGGQDQQQQLLLLQKPKVKPQSQQTKQLLEQPIQKQSLQSALASRFGQRKKSKYVLVQEQEQQVAQVQATELKPLQMQDIKQSQAQAFKLINMQSKAQKQEQERRLKLTQVQNVAQAQRYKQDTKQSQALETKQALKLSSLTAIKTSQESKAATRQRYELMQGTKQTQAQEVATQFKPLAIVESKLVSFKYVATLNPIKITPTKRQTREPIKPREREPPTPSNKVKGWFIPPEQKKREAGFNVLVRKRGKFFKVNPYALTKEGAINYGASIVGTTAAASFKLEITQGEPKGFRGLGNLQDFTLKRNIFIEKPSRRIKSPGEKAEITFKGIAARRTKGIFGGLRV